MHPRLPETSKYSITWVPPQAPRIRQTTLPIQLAQAMSRETNLMYENYLTQSSILHQLSSSRIYFVLSSRLITIKPKIAGSSLECKVEKSTLSTFGCKSSQTHKNMKYYRHYIPRLIRLTLKCLGKHLVTFKQITIEKLFPQLSFLSVVQKTQKPRQINSRYEKTPFEKHTSWTSRGFTDMQDMAVFSRT